MSRPTSPAAAAALNRVRELCLSFPGTSERLSHGEQCWFVKKQFVTMADHHHDERVACWAAAPEGAQARWVVQHPERFFVPPYLGGRGWVGVYLDVDQDWDDVAEIIEAGVPGSRSGDVAARLDAAGRLNIDRDVPAPGVPDRASQLSLSPLGACPSATTASIVSISSTDLSGR